MEFTENQSSSNEQLTLYLFVTNDWISRYPQYEVKIKSVLVY